LVDLNIIEPNPFTVFAGSNGAGKSNIFEALAFLYYLEKTQVDIAISLFGNSEDLLTRDTFSNKISFKN
jgi:AAA15 family ATPase/GTPase